jgi:hypothetical protein
MSRFTKGLFGLVLVSGFGLVALTGCEKSVDQRLSDKKSELKFLSEKEKNTAAGNASTYFQQAWPYTDPQTGKLGTKQGIFMSCEPTDSNANWKVSCYGSEVDPNTGGFVRRTVYAIYQGGQTGVSFKDN